MVERLQTSGMGIVIKVDMDWRGVGLPQVAMHLQLGLVHRRAAFKLQCIPSWHAF